MAHNPFPERQDKAAPHERVCARCSYRTARPVDRCPSCGLSLILEERTRTDRRRVPRIALPPGIQGEWDGQVAVKVIDVSPSGACLEHREPLLPSQPCVLMFTLPEKAPLRLVGRIVWSRAHLVERKSGGQEWVYRSGVEFPNLASSVARDIAAYLVQLAAAPTGILPGMVVPG